MFLYAKHVCEEINVGRLSLDNTDDFPRGLGDVKDVRNSVYSPFAASERKIQIIAISYLK